jgi:hypothetical protein
MKLSRLTIKIWIPFVFSIVLCGIVILTSVLPLGIQMPPAFPAFFCFLPMVFFFVCNAIQNQFIEFEKRIAELEIKIQNAKTS